MSTSFRLRCPAKTASDKADLFSADRGTCLPTRCIRHWRRSCAQPSRTQKLSSFAPVAVPDICRRRLRSLASADRCHSLRSLHPHLAALPSLPDNTWRAACCGARHLRRRQRAFLICRPQPLALLSITAVRQRSDRSPGKIGNANTMRVRKIPDSFLYKEIPLHIAVGLVLFFFFLK